MNTLRFRWRLAFTGVALALAPACFAQVTDVSKDPRLQKPISIKLKIVALPVALKQLSKLDGVTLENVTTISDLKITVFVQDVPAGQVLDKIASVLGCEWKADGDLLRLGMDSEVRTRRDRYVDAEDASARKEIEHVLNDMAVAASIDPAAAIQELNQRIAAGSKPSAAGGNPMDPERIALLKEASNPQDVMLGRCLAGFNSAKVSDFWRGDVVVAVAEPPRSASPDNEVATNIRSANGSQNRRTRRPPVATPIFIQYDPLLYQVRVSSRGSVRNLAMRPPSIVTQFAPTGDLAKLQFGKEVLAWDQPVPSDGDFATLTVKAAAGQSPNAEHRLSISDYLERAFDETGVPIVADAFRTPATSKDLNLGAGPLTSWLHTLKDSNHLFTRFEDGVMMVRHGGFWRLRKFETPEETLAPLEAKAAKGTPSLDDYASFLTKLTPEQAKPFSIENGSVTLFDTRPIEKALPALLFYASLDSRSISRAMHDGIAYDQLGSAQRQLFVNAALEGAFVSGTSPTFNESLMRLAYSGDARGLGFIMRKESTNLNGVSVEGQDMLFGADFSDAATYKVALAE